jgi:hypothetical protein
MDRAAKSVFVFGIYLTLLGCALIAAPDALFAWFGLPPLYGAIGPVLGTLVILIGYLCLRAARAGRKAFFHWSIHTRCWVLMTFGTYVVLGLAPPALLLFGSLDFLGAVWTAYGLRSEGGPGGGNV